MLAFTTLFISAYKDTFYHVMFDLDKEYVYIYANYEKINK